MSELKIGPGGEQIIEPSASSSKHDFDSMSASGGFGIENSKIGYVVPTTGPSSRGSRDGAHSQWAWKPRQLHHHVLTKSHSKECHSDCSIHQPGCGACTGPTPSARRFSRQRWVRSMARSGASTIAIRLREETSSFSSCGTKRMSKTRTGVRPSRLMRAKAGNGLDDALVAGWLALRSMGRFFWPGNRWFTGWCR